MDSPSMVLYFLYYLYLTLISIKNTRILAAKGVHVVVGTTGFNKIQLYELKKLVHDYKIGLVYAPNISVSVNVLLSIAKTLARLVPHYDVEITEFCHRYKKDSPSGTALKLALVTDDKSGRLQRSLGVYYS
jgi:4-hydroxy-tetrahydrodipicolinate reductase